MPYYRIMIWTNKRKQPFSGIRFVEAYNINLVYNLTMKKAQLTYRSDFIDCEVQMLSKQCAAVKKHLKDVESKKAKDSINFQLDKPEVRLPTFG
jgi:hypothetical protein